MSQELFKARRNLTQVSSLLKQGKLLSAVQGVYTSLKLLQNSSMMKSESEELEHLLQSACALLSNDKEIRKTFPLAIEYKAGKDSNLLPTLEELLDILRSEHSSDVEILAAEIKKKQSALTKGQEELQQGDYDAARKTFHDITEEFSTDEDLHLEISERFMQHSLFEDASEFLGDAVNISGGSAHAFNRLGITLRKMKRYDIAEENFKKALVLEKNDPNLYFNIGRLYLDWEKWELAALQAEEALKLDAAFTQASQMRQYARRKQAEQQ